MSDNHYIDLSVVKARNEAPFSLELCDSSFSVNANFGKLLSISFSDEILVFKFTNGYLHIDLPITELCRYLILKQTKKEK